MLSIVQNKLSDMRHGYWLHGIGDLGIPNSVLSCGFGYINCLKYECSRAHKVCSCLQKTTPPKPKIHRNGIYVQVRLYKLLGIGGLAPEWSSMWFYCNSSLNYDFFSDINCLCVHKSKSYVRTYAPIRQTFNHEIQVGEYHCATKTQVGL